MGRSLNSGTLTANGSGSATSSVVSVTGVDAFAKGDPVFLNYATGDVIKASPTFAPLSLAAGYSSSRLQTTLANPTNGASTVVVLADGSHVVLSISHTSGTTTSRIEAFKYSSTGQLLFQKTLFSTTSGVNTCTIVATVLANGNIGLVSTTLSSTLGWWILNPQIDIVYSGSVGSQSFLHSIQATSDNGFLYVGANGIRRVTGAGVESASYTFSGYTPADNNTGGNVASGYNSESTRYNNTRASFMSISSGGYGIFMVSTNLVIYYRFNADGSTRGGSATIDTTGTPTHLVTSVATGGNIGWVSYNSTNGTRWGIVADDGTIVLAAATIGSSDISGIGSYKTNLVADTNNCFLLTWSSASGATLNINYVSSTGTPKSTWPKTTALVSNNNKVWLLPTTAGVTVVFCGTTADGLNAYQTNTAGTVTLASTLIFNLGGMTSGAAADVWPTFATSGSDVYGFYGTSSQATSGIFQVLFKVSSAGVITTGLSPDTGSTNLLGKNIIITSREIKVTSGIYVRTYDLTTLGLKNVNATTANLTFNTNDQIKSKMYGDMVLLYGPDNFLGANFSGNGGAVVYRVKQYSTILLGIATSASTAGGKVTIGTKGVFDTTWNVAQTYDQSGNNPVGNKGSFAGSIATCLGLGV